MATVGEQLVISYARAKAQNPSLRKGQYMQKVFQGRYKNEESAYQAYNQTVKGKRSGKRLSKLAYDAQPPVRNPEIREKIRTGQIKRRPRPSMTRKGLWKVNIYFTYIDQDGQEREEVRSFIAESAEYTSLMDIPYIEEIVAASAEEYVELWVEGDSLNGNYIDKRIEVVPIYRSDTDTPERMQLDRPAMMIVAEEWPE